MDEEPVDLEFGWSGDYDDPTRDLRPRVISSSDDNGIWVCIERRRGGRRQPTVLLDDARQQRRCAVAYRQNPAGGAP